MKKKVKITDKDFELFKSECRKWLAYFGLTNWDVSIFREKDDRYFGWASFCHDGRQASIYLNSDWSGFILEDKVEEIKQTAFHEVCEILIYPLRYVAECRYVLGPEEINTRVHDLIRILENTLYRGKEAG